MFVRIIPLMFASLFLGAHFLRTGNIVFFMGSLLFPSLLMIKKRASLVAVQVFAYIGAFIWLTTTIVLVKERMVAGASWGRMGIILGFITFFTAFAGLLLNSETVKKHYPSKSESQNEDSRSRNVSYNKMVCAMEEDKEY